MMRTQPGQYISGNMDQFFRTYLTPGMFYGHSLWAFTGLVAALPLLLLLIRLFNTTQPNQQNRPWRNWIKDGTLQC